jgi:hypothetical protein
VAGTDDSISTVRGLGVARTVELVAGMRIALVLLIALAGTARAQAPGDCAVVAPATGRDVMADRFSVGFGVGSIGLAPPKATDTTNYGIAELAFRFRLTPHFELEAAFSGGDSQDKTTTLGVGAVGVRYRFHPADDWNVWFMGAFGGATITTTADMTSVERPIAELGAGIERRFGHLGLQAELRAIAAGEPTATVTTTARSVTVAPDPSTDTLGGAELTLGATYYF